MLDAWKRESHCNLDDQYIYFLQIFTENNRSVTPNYGLDFHLPQTNN